MAKFPKILFVEKRQKEGDFAVREKGAQRASKIAPTQAKAIAKAEKMKPQDAIVIERVKNTNKGRPGEWRK